MLKKIIMACHYYKIFGKRSYKGLLLVLLVLISSVIFLERCSTFQSQKLIKHRPTSSYLDLPEGFTPDFVVYYINGSTATIPAIIHMLKHSIRSIAHIARGALNSLPSHVTSFSSLAHMVKKIELLLKELPSSKILIITDYPWLMILHTALNLHLSAENIHTIILEEGTSLYNPREKEQINVELYQDMVKVLHNEELSYEYGCERYKHSSGVFLSLMVNSNHIREDSHIGTVNAWYFYPECLLKGAYSSLLQIFSESSFAQCFNKLDLCSYFNLLSNVQKEEFKKIFRLYNDEEEIFALYEKVVLILLSGNSTKEEELNRLKRIIKYFGSEYTYLLKDHPLVDREFDDLPFGTYLVNNTIVAESILLSYADKIHAVVGKDTSAFMSVPKNIKIYMYEEPNLEPFVSLYKENHAQFCILP